MDKRTRAPGPCSLMSMGFFLLNVHQRMTVMTSTSTHCLLRTGSSYLDSISSNRRPIDSQTTQAFHQLRLHAEELALELAARLRVLGKSLAAACKGPRAEREIGSPSAYTGIRRQLDDFFGSMINENFAGHNCIPVVQDFIQENLPSELSSCGNANTCRIETVENVISLLSECSCGHDAFTDGLIVSYS